MLLYKCVLHYVVTSSALYVSHVFITDPSMFVQVVNADICLANRTLYNSPAALFIMTFQFSVVWCFGTTIISTQESQILEDFHRISWKWSSTHILRAFERTDLLVVVFHLPVVEACRAEWSLAFLTSCRILGENVTAEPASDWLHLFFGKTGQECFRNSFETCFVFFRLVSHVIGGKFVWTGCRLPPAYELLQCVAWGVVDVLVVIHQFKFFFRMN